MKKILLIPLLASSIIGSQAYADFDPSSLEPVQSNFIPLLTPVATGISEKAILLGTAKPYNFATSPVWGKANNIATAVGALATKLSGIYINQQLTSYCKSDSLYNSEDNCFTPPSFKPGYFCISTYDVRERIRASKPIYTFTAAHFTDDSELERSPDLYNTPRESRVNSGKQVCYSFLNGTTHLKIFDEQREHYGRTIFKRALDERLFDGRHGGVVKNGKFHLVQKRSEPLDNNPQTMGKLCDLTRYIDISRSLNECHASVMHEYGHQVRSKSKLNDYLKINVKSVSFDSNDGIYESFEKAIGTKNYVLSRYDIEKGLNFFRKFKVTSGDQFLLPNLFTLSDIGKSYYLYVNYNYNKYVDFETDKFINNGIHLKIIKDNRDDNIIDERDVYHKAEHYFLSNTK